MLRNLLRKLATGRAMQTGDGATRANVLKPGAPFFAVGDIHGRLDLLDELLAMIDPSESERLIFLGDYVDRGPQSAETLVRLFDLSQRRPDQIVCLMGNHEKMMLDFIDDPLGRGARWLRNGGIETLASCGISGLSERAGPDEAIDACDALERALPKELIAWVRDLPLYWNSGNIWCVHAAMDPKLSPRAQKTQTMLWGHRDFLKLRRKDEACVVHGHTVVSDPTNLDSRIAVDTGAYRTGRLTAVQISDDQCVFIQAKSPQH